MNREELIDAVWDAMDSISDLHNYAVAVVDKIILPMRDELQAAHATDMQATIDECERQRNEQ